MSFWEDTAATFIKLMVLLCFLMVGGLLVLTLITVPSARVAFAFLLGVPAAVYGLAVLVTWWGRVWGND